ncbi:MAG: ECF transporter S component [Candidatus Bathycorpusculaceae bacterium]
MNKQSTTLVFSGIGGILAGIISIFEVFSILSDMGFTILEKISLTDSQKIFISLLIFFGLFTLILALTSIYVMRKGHAKVSSISSFAGVISALLGLITPSMFGFAQSSLFLIGMILSMVLMGTGAIIALTVPSKALRGPMLTSVEVAVVALFSALYAVLIVFTFQIYPVPSPTGGFLHFGDFVVFLVALLFGAKVGGLVGVVGAVVADFYLAYPRWYVSIIAHGLEGVVPGFTKKRNIVLQLIACILGGLLMAATYFFVNIFIKGYPVAVISFVQDLFLQAGVSIALGLPTVKIVERTLPWFR